MLKQSILQLASKIIKLLLGFSVSVAISRHFGPDLYGSYVFGIAIYSLVSVIVVFGLESLVLKEIFRNSKKLPNGILIQLAIAMALLFLLVIVFLPIILLSKLTLGYQVVMMLCISLIFQPFLLLKVGLIKRERWVLISQIEIASIAFGATLKFIVILSGLPIVAVAFAVILETLIAALLYINAFFKISRRYCYWLYRSVVGSLRSRKIDENLLKKSLPEVTSSLIAVLLLANDKLMLGILSGGSELGIYAVAQTIAQAFMILPVALGPIIEVRLNVSYLKSSAKFKKDVVHAYLATAAIGILIYAAMYQISGHMIMKIYGEIYRDSIEILKMLCFANIFVFLVSLTRRVHVVKGGGWYTAKNYLAMLIFNAISCYYLILENGALGAAQACLYTWMFGVFIFVVRNVVSDEKI